MTKQSTRSSQSLKDVVISWYSAYSMRLLRFARNDMINNRMIYQFEIDKIGNLHYIWCNETPENI